jgi:hypothetical protein
MDRDENADVLGGRERIAEPGHRVRPAASVQQQERAALAVFADRDVNGADAVQVHAAGAGDHGVSRWLGKPVV